MSPFPQSNDKREWREWAMTLRSMLDIHNADVDTVPRLIRLNEWIKSRRILLYAATRSEINVHGVLEDKTGKHWHYPRCAPKRKLVVHRVLSGLLREWTVSRFGIDEPPADTPEVDPESIDLVVVPALAFDERGYRIGYGGGYYDRFLPRLRPDCVTVGVTLDALVVPTLPAEPHDFPVQIIVTETRTIRREDTTARTPPPYSG